MSMNLFSRTVLALTASAAFSSADPQAEPVADATNATQDKTEEVLRHTQTAEFLQHNKTEEALHAKKYHVF